jgi:hydroxyacylglutathione hydrolase
MALEQIIVDMQALIQIIPIPAFNDNYIWLIHNGSFAIVVDPGDATPVLEVLNRLDLRLNTILITHHHHDHIDGVSALLEAFPEVNIYAPKLEKYAFKHTPVNESQSVELLSFNLKFSVIDVPGHTLGHVAYYSEQAYELGENNMSHLLFCGDTLFGAGCGRLFEGTAAQMLSSLSKLAALPANTKVFCTHEYTLHNINFALTLEPHNQALIQRHADTIKLRNTHQVSLPSSIALELASNPFLRCNSPEIKSSLQLENAACLETFSAIRELRNHY